MLVIDETAAQFFDGFFKFKPNHESASAYFLDLREFLEFFQQIVTYFSCILYQTFLFDGIHHGKGCRTCQMVSAEGGSQLSVYRFEHRANQHACHRESVSDTFGYGNNIRLDVIVLVGEEFTATSVSALDFIENQDSSCFGTYLAKFLHKFGSRYLDTPYTLYSFNDNGASISFGKFLLHRFDVVQRKIGYVSVIVDGSDDGRIVGCFYCQ